MNTRVRDVIFRQERTLTSPAPHPFVIVHICTQTVHYMCVCTSNTEVSLKRTGGRSIIVNPTPNGPFSKKSAIECKKVYEALKANLNPSKMTGEINREIFRSVFTLLVKNIDLKTSFRKALAARHPELVPKELGHLLEAAN